jgi:hypothetical protein
MKRTANAISYTLLNFRYGSLILPVGVVAYLLGVPGLLVVTAVVLLAGAFAAEVVTSILNGIHTAMLIHHQQHDESVMWDELARYANTGGLDDGEGTAPEGEDPSEGEGQAAR